MSIKIIADSTSYIPQEIREQYDISICPLNIIFQGQSYDETTMDRTAFYEKILVASEIPSSSQPSLEEVYNIFEKEVKQNNSVIGVFLSSDMSGSYSSANLVKEMIMDKYPEARIEIVDSRTNCMQEGFLAIAAAKAAEEGKTIEEILEIIEKIKLRSRFLFVPNTLDYLKKGGRIGGAAALIGSFLKIMPILTVEDGKTTVYTKVRTKKKAIDAMINAFTTDVDDKGLGEVVVHHINSKAEGIKLAKRLEEILGMKVEVCDIGPVIGVHVGPDAVGIAYYTKNPIR